MQFPNLEIIPATGPEEIALETARLIRALSPDAFVAVSGGTTYRRIVEAWREALGSTRVKLFPVDERMVPFDSPESNWGMIQRDLLDPLDWPELKRCFVESMSQDSARDYERLLRSLFPTTMPQFDLIFLGVGADGHTASLFPGGGYLDDNESWVLQTKSPAPPRDRITLGMGAICAARQVVIIMTDEAKRPVVQRMLKGDEALPIVRVLRHPVKKLLFLDQSAAGE
ncbi:MAG: 6-phosphogluconolactonase [Desulfobacterales bacterium]|nr:MAG: 6-phosphogluconolactonase [Desulfobacterales bacterium]UCG80251.1 MAG: 6-phosphogluconolactonase [Desulfobacterales bacterium]